MTKEQRARQAILWMIRDQIDWHHRAGIELTEAEAIQKVMEIVRAVEGKRDHGKLK